MTIRMTRIVLLVGVLLGMPGCTGFLETDVNTLAEIEGFIGAALPASAEAVQFESGGFMDVFVLLRASLPPDNARTYLAGLGIVMMPGEMPFNPDAAPTDAAWWTPTDTATFSGGTLSRYDINRHFLAALDQTDPTRWTLYLMVYST